MSCFYSLDGDGIIQSEGTLPLTLTLTPLGSRQECLLPMTGWTNWSFWCHSREILGAQTSAQESMGNCNKLKKETRVGLFCMQRLLSSLNHSNGNGSCSVVIARFVTQTLHIVRSNKKVVVHRHAVNSCVFMPVELGEFSEFPKLGEFSDFRLWWPFYCTGLCGRSFFPEFRNDKMRHTCSLSLC